MVVPVPVVEVWSRMLRNLLNCSKRAGDVVNTALLQQLLPAPGDAQGNGHYHSRLSLAHIELKQRYY